MRLGLWIAPTDVAETSEMFREHPEWMAPGRRRQAAPNWQWFWKPNPDMPSWTPPTRTPRMDRGDIRPAVGRGRGYYKIDFIAGSPALRRAMAAIRRGAGPDAWIRYCQTPPLLSVGLANSAYIGDDTLDAGLAIG